MRMAMATVAVHVVWGHLAAGYSQFTGGCVSMHVSRVLTGRSMKPGPVVDSLFQESPYMCILHNVHSTALPLYYSRVRY